MRPTRLPRRLGRRGGAGVALAALVAAGAAGCGSAGRGAAPPALGAATGRAAAAARPAAPASTAAPTTVAPTTSTTPPPPVEQPGWSVVAEVGNRIVTDLRPVTASSGDSVTLVRFRAGTYRLALHPGGTVSAAERPWLLGAFNGGFKPGTGAGGAEMDGQVITPLAAGDESLVVDTDGAVHLGVWGVDLPVPGEQVWSVRQNLRPLITHGQVSPAVGDVWAWGATLGGGAKVARSAVGLDAAGDLVYAAGMSLLPADLAQALGAAGVVEAMELDINPEWVQADVAAAPGGPLSAAVPGQQRPADQYLAGWSRDFVAVLAAH